MRNDPNLEALVSISQMVMRMRHPDSWLQTGGASHIAPDVVGEVWPLLHIGDDTIIAEAIDEIKQRYGAIDEDPEVIRQAMGLDEPDDDACSNPGGHSWVCTGTQYGGDDESYFGEGRCYCVFCGADGDA